MQWFSRPWSSGAAQDGGKSETTAPVPTWIGVLSTAWSARQTLIAGETRARGGRGTAVFHLVPGAGGQVFGGPGQVRASPSAPRCLQVASSRDADPAEPR